MSALTPSVVALSVVAVTAGGCATLAVDRDQFQSTVPAVAECDYIEEDGTQAWQCGDKGLFAADYDYSSHEQVVKYWSDYITESSPSELVVKVEPNVPPLEHEGTKYPVSMVRFLYNGQSAVNALVLSRDHDGGRRGWVCMASAMTSEDDLAPWCGKMLKGLVLAQR